MGGSVPQPPPLPCVCPSVTVAQAQAAALRIQCFGRMILAVSLRHNLLRRRAAATSIQLGWRMFKLRYEAQLAVAARQRARVSVFRAYSSPQAVMSAALERVCLCKWASLPVCLLARGVFFTPPVPLPV